MYKRQEEDGIKLSQEAIRRYYHSQILPARLARQNKTAEELNKISCLLYTSAPRYTLARKVLQHPKLQGLPLVAAG